MGSGAVGYSSTPFFTLSNQLTGFVSVEAGPGVVSSGPRVGCVL